MLAFSVILQILHMLHIPGRWNWWLLQDLDNKSIASSLKLSQSFTKPLEKHHGLDGFAQDHSNTRANARVLLQSCTSHWYNECCVFQQPKLHNGKIPDYRNWEDQ